MEIDLVIRLAAALVVGAILGFEREYRSKSAGFRTLIIITIGATLFTICSFKLGAPGNPDRIASNIITGIGFIGAGVIFKDGLTISGITTAATIWIAAALGMAIGIGQFGLVGAALLLTLIVLALFEKVQSWIESIHQQRIYKINIALHYETVLQEIETQLKAKHIGFERKRWQRHGEEVSLTYSLSGNQKELEAFTAFLIKHRDIKSFEE